MKTPINRHHGFLITLLMMLIVVFSGCSKDEDSEIFGLRNGQVRNRVTGVGIPDIPIMIKKSGLFTQYSSVTTDENGRFQIKRTDDRHINLYFAANILESYQRPFWVNNIFSPGSTLEIHYTFGTSKELILELYPKTYFKIILSNINQAFASDVIYLTIQNMCEDDISCFPLEQQMFSFKGIHTNTIIEGVTFHENILTFTYRIEDAAGIQEYSRTVTCEPGGMTEIVIEY
jgi:hypothetical protein